MVYSLVAAQGWSLACVCGKIGQCQHRQGLSETTDPVTASSCVWLATDLSLHAFSIVLSFVYSLFSFWWGEWSLDSEGDNISDVRKVQPHMSGVDEGRLCEVRPIPHGLYSSRRRDHQPAIPPFIAVHHSQHHGHLLPSHMSLYTERK